jgi:hypothetical protein
MYHWRSALAAGLALALLWPVCPTTAGEDPNAGLPPGVRPPLIPPFVRGDENADDGDWLVNTLHSEPNSLNPLIDNDATASDLFGFVHDSLATRLFEDLAVWEPQLARAWKKEMQTRRRLWVRSAQ